MAHPFALPLRSRRSMTIWALAALALVFALLAVQVLWAQVEGERGIAAIASSSDIDVSGIEVDVRGSNAEDARARGWREAQRKAWAKLGGPGMSDGQLQGLVSAIVIERERIGPRRYIARLGVIFDRARAGRMLGKGGERAGSAPMLLVPVTLTGGAAMVYEKRNAWQRAWAEYQAGASRINYVRPSGAGGDSLLLTYGQTARRSRLWWRNILDQFEAADVLVPIAELTHQWPGGPIEGSFTARYGPDNRYLDGFRLTAENPDQLDEMLRQAVLRFDDIFEQALVDGKLRPDPTLRFSSVDADPALQRLIEIGRAVEAQERAAAAAEQAGEVGGETETAQPAPSSPPTEAAAVSSHVVQFATPDAGAFDATIAGVRSTPGVRGAAVTSTAIGGSSVMSVAYGGSLEQLAAALRARGFTVRQGSNALAISR